MGALTDLITFPATQSLNATITGLDAVEHGCSNQEGLGTIHDGSMIPPGDKIGMSGVHSEIEAHILSLRRYARALNHNQPDAEDLVQEALTRALDRADRFQAGTNLRAWLLTILHNVHINHVRSRTSRSVEVLTDDMIGQLGVAARQDGHVALHDLARALDTLPPGQRQVILLVGVEGMTYDEVATILDIPMGTVMSRLSRARTALRERLEPAHEGETEPKRTNDIEAARVPTLRRVK